MAEGLLTGEWGTLSSHAGESSPSMYGSFPVDTEIEPLLFSFPDLAPAGDGTIRAELDISVQVQRLEPPVRSNDSPHSSSSPGISAETGPLETVSSQQAQLFCAEHPVPQHCVLGQGLSG